MLSLFARLLILPALAHAILCPVAFAQETPATEEPANEEMTYFDLRRSKDNRTKQFAERYFNLVKPQEWTSKSGTSKISAKYVAHDPDLKWVKLAATRGSGASRTVREITVEVAKLNATSQSRVRQIDVLQKKMDELVVEEQKRQEEEDTESRAGGYGDEGIRGREETGERGGRAGRYGEVDSATTTEPAGYEQTEAASDATATAPEVPDGSDDPDPLGFGELEGDLTAAAAAGANPALTGGRAALYGRAAADAAAAGQSVDRTQWATSVAAFHANFTSAGDEGSVPNVDWGELADLRQMNDAAYAGFGDGSDGNRTAVTEIADRIGEVQWEAVFQGLGEDREGRREVRFDVPPLPRPLFLRFLVDAREAGGWAAVRPGEQVRFAGRFDIMRPGEILVLVSKVD